MLIQQEITRTSQSCFEKSALARDVSKGIKPMETPKIILMTQRDETRLKALISTAGSNERNLLESLVANATIVSSEQIPSDTVTMNSRIRLKDVESGHELERDLLFPHDVNRNKDAISILSSEGIALFGLSEGEFVNWAEPNGKLRKLKVTSVVWQPETEGLFQF